MIFTNPFTKLKRFTSKSKNISKIRTERGEKHKTRILSKLIKILVLCFVIISVITLIYLAIPNIRAINEFKPKTLSETNKALISDRINILLVIKENRNGYDLLKSLDLISYERGIKKIEIKAINTKTIVQDSTLGKNINVENIYQLNKLSGGGNTELLNYFENLLAVKLDNYLVIPMDYFNDSLKITGPIKFQNDYTSDNFAKGSISVTSTNITEFWNSTFSNDGQRLVDQNKFLQAYFSKIGSVESLFNYTKLSEISSKYIDTNMSETFFREFLSSAMFNSDKIGLGFSPTQLFLNTPEGRYWDKSKFDEYIKNEFSDTKIQREQARVEVQNASGVQGLASKVSRFVSNSGAGVSRVGNFGIEVPKTTVYIKDNNKFAETVNFLENLLVGADFRFESPEKLSTADILIIVKDF